MGSTRVSDIDSASSFQTPTTINTLPDELLLAVFRVLSITDRAKVRTVSKKWNRLVMDLGIHLEPLFVDDKLGIPFYSNEIAIQLHHAAVTCYFTDHTKLADDLKIPFKNLTEAGVLVWLPLNRSEFLTDPPISTLAFQVIAPTGTPRENQMRAVLRNSKSSGGIRLGEFLDMCEKMRVYDARLRLECWSMLAWFAMEGNGVHYDYVCEPASTKNGIEVRECTKKDD